MDSRYNSREEGGVYLILSVIIGIVIGLIYMSASTSAILMPWGDWFAHSDVAEEMSKGGDMPPHFLFQILLIALGQIFDAPFINLTPVAVFLIVFVTYISAYRLFLNATHGYLPPCYALVGASFLLLSHPIAVLFQYDYHLYFGYIASNVYHNPSILIVKPIALLHFSLLCFLVVAQEKRTISVYSVLLLAALTVLSIIAKPNYIVALLPALFVLLILRFAYVRDNLKSLLVIVVLGVVVPAIMFLAWQYHHFYVARDESGIRVGLFEIFGYSSQLWTLLPKLVLSIAFPLSVVALMWRTLIRQVDFQLATLMFGVSLVYIYVLVDAVDGRTADGNFWWSAQIAAFVLIYVCIRNYLLYLISARRSDIAYSWSSTIYIPLYVASLHFLYGTVWFVTNIFPPYRSW